MFWHTEIHDHEDELDMCRKLNRYITYLLSVTVMVFSTAMLTYGEKFLFWEHAFSYLGGIQTQSGTPNSTSFIICGFGMILCSLICFRISNVLDGKSAHLLFRFCGAGFLLMIAPCDVINMIHTIGSALVFGTLWLFTVSMLNGLHHIHPFRVYLYQFILQGTVLPYAVMYVAGSPYRQAAQKLAVFGLILILKMATLEHLRVAQHNAAHS